MQRLDERDEQGEKLLLSSVKSPYSKQTYKFYLRKYLSINGYQNAAEVLAKSTKEIEYEIRDFIISQKEKGMRYAAIYNYVKPIISMCKLSDKMINTKRIEKFMPPNVRTKKTTAYDIAKLLEVADERMKVVILLCSSAGLRIGAIPSLNWGSLQEVGDVYQICVYEGEPEEYITFCSNEAKNAILSYISVRERYGEVILPSSPLVREQWDRNDLCCGAST